VLALLAPSFHLFDDLRQEFNGSQESRAFWDAMDKGERGDNWRVVDGLVTVHGRVYVSSSSPLMQEVIAGTHGAGHEGVQKTMHHLCADLFMPVVCAAVQDFVQACDICQRHKTEQLQPTSLLQPLDLRGTVWIDPSMDFVEGLSCVNGNSVILTVVDRFSKVAHFIPLVHPYTATMVTHAFLDSIVCLHGVPSSIISDRDLVFTNRF
jgi:hypothetical protein